MKKAVYFFSFLLLTTTLLSTIQYPKIEEKTLLTHRSEKDFLEFFSSLSPTDKKRFINHKIYGKKPILLHEIVKHNWNRATHTLLNHDVNVNEQDIYGQTALHIAIENNLHLTALSLLAHSPNISLKRGYDSATPLTILLQKLTETKNHQHTLFCMLALMMKLKPHYNTYDLELAEKIILEKHWHCEIKTCSCQWNNLLQSLKVKASLQLQKPLSWTFNSKKYIRN